MLGIDHSNCTMAFDFNQTIEFNVRVWQDQRTEKVSAPLLISLSLSLFTVFTKTPAFFYCIWECYRRIFAKLKNGYLLFWLVVYHFRCSSRSETGYLLGACNRPGQNQVLSVKSLQCLLASTISAPKRQYSIPFGASRCTSKTILWPVCKNLKEKFKLYRSFVSVRCAIIKIKNKTKST